MGKVLGRGCFVIVGASVTMIVLVGVLWLILTGRIF